MSHPMQDVIYKLPLSQFFHSCEWPTDTLAKAVNVLGGGTPDTDIADYWHPQEIPWATPTDITGTEGNEIVSTERYISRSGLRQSTLVPENSVLMTSRATIGAAKINRVPMAINQGFATLVPKAGFSAEYLFYLIEIIRPTLVRLGAGTTFLEVSRREIKKILIRIPEENEQRRIASALKLASDAIAKTKAELDATREFTRSLTAALLVPSTDERWQPTTFASIIREKIRNGYSPACPQDPTGAWVLSLDALTDERFNSDGIKPAPIDDDGLLPFKLEIDDILVSRSNTPELVGRAGRYVGQPEVAYYPDLMMRIRVNSNIVSPAFAELLLRSSNARRWLKSRASGTSGSMVKIKRRDILSLPILLPSPTRQTEIVSTVAAAYAALDSVKKRLSSLQEVNKCLLQNLLTGKIRIPEGVLNE